MVSISWCQNVSQMLSVKSFEKSSEIRSGTTIQNSGSQPGCRGTLRCCEEVQGVPPNIGFSCYLLVFLMKLINFQLQGCLKVVVYQCKGAAKSFQSIRVPRTKKRLRNTDLESYDFSLFLFQDPILGLTKNSRNRNKQQRNSFAVSQRNVSNKQKTSQNKITFQ